MSTTSYGFPAATAAVTAPTASSPSDAAETVQPSFATANVANRLLASESSITSTFVPVTSRVTGTGPARGTACGADGRRPPSVGSRAACGITMQKRAPARTRNRGLVHRNKTASAANNVKFEYRQRATQEQVQTQTCRNAPRRPPVHTTQHHTRQSRTWQCELARRDARTRPIGPVCELERPAHKRRKSGAERNPHARRPRVPKCGRPAPVAARARCRRRRVL